MFIPSTQQIALQNYFGQQSPVQRAWLFGSYANGTATEDSDIDLLVEFDYTQHVGLGIVTMHRDLEVLLQKKVDLVPYDGLSRFIRANVEAQKSLLYEKR